jgi:cytochrome P450
MDSILVGANSGSTFDRASIYLVLTSRSDLGGSRTLTIHELHKQYGPIVRIAPDELSFTTNEAIRDIYGQQTQYMKAEIYDSMSVPPYGIFSLRTREAHSQRRRLLSHAFAQSSLLDSEPLIRAHVEQLYRIIQSRLSQPVDVMRLFRLVAFDIVGE